MSFPPKDKRKAQPPLGGVQAEVVGERAPERTELLGVRPNATWRDRAAVRPQLLDPQAHQSHLPCGALPALHVQYSPL